MDVDCLEEDCFVGLFFLGLGERFLRELEEGSLLGLVDRSFENDRDFDRDFDLEVARICGFEDSLTGDPLWLLRRCCCPLGSSLLNRLSL